MKFERASGVILHPSSLPGPYGIGDLGDQAYQWIDFLSRAGCQIWQILPLSPTGYGDSPYQCFSAFAGNPYLISPESLLSQGLLDSSDLDNLPAFPSERVDYGTMIPWKLDLLDRAYHRFHEISPTELQRKYNQFLQEQSNWLDDFTLFMALKEYYGGAPWTSWDAKLRDRQPQALQDAQQTLSEAIQKQAFRQFVFFQQWTTLHDYARENKVLIIGDIPIFVAHDSADVWSHPELFALDSAGKPEFAAGVPPDYFSPTGQLWGNPLYHWDVHKASGYQWWIERFRSVLSMVDIVRLDHFRGFAGYWEVPGDAKTAEKGRWVPGPGADFLATLEQALGELPIIAEDLGVITPDVVKLRDSFKLPGMKILQFAFAGGPTDPFLPHNFPNNCVVYTGTHDNDTVLGWYQRVEEEEKAFYRRYLNRDGSDVSWDLIRACWASVAVLSIAPMQDFLCLGNEARMNYPGNPSGNWTWRMSSGALSQDIENGIKELNYLYSRLPVLDEEEVETEIPEDYFSLEV
jgi:4-alpha-glucanotransferase